MSRAKGNAVARRRHQATRPIATLGMLLLAVAAAHAEQQFDLRVGAALTWVDNIELTPTDEQDDLLLQIDPGVTWKHSDQRLQAFLEYTMQNIFSMDDSDRNSTYHYLDSAAKFAIVQDLFSVEAAAGYTQVMVVPERPANFDNLFGVGNISDVGTARITPQLRHEFGATLLEIEYTYGWVDYRNDDNIVSTTLADSREQGGKFFAGSAAQDDQITWGIAYNGSRTDYKDDAFLDFAFDSAYAELGAAATRHFHLIGRYGMETDLVEDQTDGGFDAPFWQAGFRWQTGQQDRLEVFYGDRTYGHGWQANWSRTARLLRLAVSYVDEPTTEQSTFATRPVDYNQIQPPPNASDFNRVTTLVYVREALAGDIELNGRRTSARLRLETEDRKYLTSGLRDQSKSAGLELSRRASTRHTLSLGGGYSDVKLLSGAEYNDTTVQASLTSQLSTAMALKLLVRHDERDGNVESYDVNWVTLRVDMTF